MEPEVAQRVAELERQLAEAMAAAQAQQRGSAQSAQALGRIVELTAELGQILQADPQSLPSVEIPERAEVFGGVVAESPYVAIGRAVAEDSRPALAIPSPSPVTCVSLTTGATRSQVSVEHADAINVTGFDSEYFIAADCAGLTVTADGNEVHVGSVDAVNISGDDNTVIYKSGSPEVADAGEGNVIAERE